MAELYDTMISLAQELYIATRALLVQKGVKANSDLVRSIEVRADQNLIRMLSEDYMEYVSKGRKAGGKKVPIRYILEFIQQNNLKGRRQSQQAVAFAIAQSIKKRRGSAQMPPTSALLGWMEANGIEGKELSPNALAWAIQNAIYKRGIRGKNFYEQLVQMFEDMGEKKITTDVEKKMLNVLDNAKIN